MSVFSSPVTNPGAGKTAADRTSAPTFQPKGKKAPAFLKEAQFFKDSTTAVCPVTSV